MGTTRQEVFARDSTMLHKDLGVRTRNSADHGGSTDVPAVKAPDMERYDEFAIGWNEIFDLDMPSSLGAIATNTSASSSAVPAVPGDARRPRASQTASAGTSSTDGGVAFWQSEVLTSKKPPVYLRVAGGQKSAIHKGMKERLMDCPVRELRKPAEVMEVQLDQLRARVAEAHCKKQREARQHRRLQRKCRVRDSEDVEELKERYAKSDFLKPLFPGLLETAPSARGPPPNTTLASKDFFMRLGRRQFGGSSGACSPASARLSQSARAVGLDGPPTGARAATAVAAASGSHAAFVAAEDPPHTAR